jgi:dihydroxy-acid dehydratase
MAVAGPPAAAGHLPRAVGAHLRHAVAAATASGGSTNAVLHLLAMAGEIGVELSLADIDAVSRRTPLLGDLKPGGRFTAAELHRADCVPALLRELADVGLIDGSAITVTGRSLGEELDRQPRPPVDQARQVIRPTGAPLSSGAALLE